MKLPKGFQTIGPPPYKFQIETIAFGILRHNAGIFLDLGLGKTRCAIDIARYRIQNDGVEKILVLCPTSLLLNWKGEVKKFSEYKSLIAHHHDKDERSARLRSNKHQFYIINYESLFPTLANMDIVYKDIFKGKSHITLVENYSKLIRDLNFRMIIFDESARYIKNHAANRTFASILFADEADYKLILTGTPIASKPLDVWSQFRVLDGGETFGTNFYRFRGHYFVKIKKGRWNSYIMKHSKTKEMSDKIFTDGIKISKEECFNELPEKVFRVIELPLDYDLEKLYSRMKKEILMEINTPEGNKSLTLTNIFTKLLRLQQLTSGFVGSKGNESQLAYTPKLIALKELIEHILDADESIIVWCRFLYSIKMISKLLKSLKIKHITMSGEDKGNDKYNKWKGFQKNKSIKIFIGQIESGGIGTELFKIGDLESKSQHMIFYENVWGMDTRLQAIDRIHRIGQKSKFCMYYDIIIKDTIDERLINLFYTNKKIADIIMKNGVESVV